MTTPSSILLKIPRVFSINGLLHFRYFSRKSINDKDPFKVVKSKRTQKDETVLAWKDPNFEMLASKCFPFFMPGNVGPAWYDTFTTIRNEPPFIMNSIEENQDADIICKIQTCPKVLRKTVIDLFPYRTLERSELSVITITIKSDLKLLRKNKEIETEKLAQAFVLAAKNVCNKLRAVGYWADFINPFSGRPYFFFTQSEELYSTHEKFRCLDFQIYEIEKCLIVSNEEDKTKKSFIGSLFTNAPSQKRQIRDIFSK